ncbi:heme peroxidase [Coprinopsis cinerea okayama7|uniref:Heme peroxidase n=1 Tax=Coprinopsis cinerea (strain Okayama-7 / 130 / ATCC MYA-4618 / FGSC 9003) TaxID=240176 RepID=A8N8W9_COPC7|nr:heme peroxidase [Coprinopsis cinerea okayama7\|eukprot:XP_001831297.2 heme peroxidase [Coprinopsis cinerea okayama7\
MSSSKVKRMSTLFRKKEKEPSTSNGVVTNGAEKKDEAASPTSPTSPLSPSQEAEGMKTMRNFRESVKKGSPFDFSTSSIAAVLDLIRNKESIDDRKLFLEHALTFISRLEEGPLARTLKNKIIQLLYNDLTHPASTSVSNQFAWRTADGSCNNVDIPDMGKAGTPYSRSVQQTVPLPKNQMPDAGLLFDTLLRREKFVPHPGGLSSLMFAFATLVIHTVFRTSHRDWTINETSSYVDLAPLYGNNEDDQNRIRIRDGRGHLYPDVFAEDRLLLLPPAVCALLVLFSRNHNYIATKLLEVNERGTFVDPSTLSMDDPKQKAKLMAQDEELFQTARLVNCGWFAMVVFSDYFSCILGLVRDGNSWSLTPFDEIRMEDHTLFERGKGNSCSVEFNCLYRWHTTTSREDEKWTEGVFSQLFPGKPFEEVTIDDFKTTAHKLLTNRPPTTEWTFGGLKRQPDGRFRDEDLARIIQDATECEAAAFGARGTPAVMRLNEIMGIEQSRRWGVCSLNEFRKFLGLKPYETFLEWNSDPDVARTAELLYGDINKLELYVGLQAEEAKPLVDGAGLCPGYTCSRAILSDAIALTRGDRFFTHDFTPFNLTAWGYQDCQRDPNAWGFGSTMARLFLRTLPEDFDEKSVYTFFPLMTPQSMKVHLTKLNQLDNYDLARPKRNPCPTIIRDYPSVVAILNEPLGFRSPYSQKTRKIINGPIKGFYPAEGPKEQDVVRKALSGSPEVVGKVGTYFYEQIKKTIDENSYTFVNGKKRGIDVVKKVINTVPTAWLGDLGGLHVKTSKDSAGNYTVDELFQQLSEIYSFIFLNVDPAKVMVLQEKVRKYLKVIIPDIKDNFTGSFSLTGLFNTVFKYKKPVHHEIISRLTENETLKNHDVLSNVILALVVVGNAEITLASTNILDYYLGSDKAADIGKLAAAGDVAGLKPYIYEALRAVPPFAGVYRVSTREQIFAGRKFAESERVFLDITAANNQSREESTKEILRAEGAFEYLGEELTVEILAQIIRAIFERPGLTRAPGHSGQMSRFKTDNRPECHHTYLHHGERVTEWPYTLSVLYDAA